MPHSGVGSPQPNRILLPIRSIGLTYTEVVYPNPVRNSLIHSFQSSPVIVVVVGHNSPGFNLNGHGQMQCVLVI